MAKVFRCGFLSFFAALCFSLNAQIEKADPSLLNALAAEGKAECIVVLKYQADVSGADLIRKKSDKGRYVYETLLAAAEATQGPLRKLIRDAGAPLQSFWIVNGVWTVTDIDLLLQIAELPEVERIEFNPVWRLKLPPQVQSDMVEDRLTAVSWGLTNINADDVWAMNFKGQGVVVGGQDTGYEWAHPALKEKYRGWTGTVADHNYNWHDAIHNLINGGTNSCGLNLKKPCDDLNHGTHTMGTMVGSPDANNVYGVAPEAEWMGCRNMEEGDGTPATYIECFEWFIAPTDTFGNNPNPGMAPAVINNSWGCPTSEGCNSSNYATMETVVNNVRTAGILVVTSAGNSGSNCSTVDAPPSIFPGSFAVGAYKSDNIIAAFSSRGPVTVYGNHMKPDISAPGVDIPSCIGHDNNASTYAYASSSGTSMAGPHVAGAAALIMSARPDLIGQVGVLETLLKNSAVTAFPPAPYCGSDNATADPNNVYGHGRLDALAAVNAAIAAPVEFVRFTARAEGKNALLQWETASEQDCARFDIQRGTDGLQWALIGEKACLGTGGKYTFIDERPGLSIAYYRLKQVDTDGTVLYSNAVAVPLGNTGSGMKIVPARKDRSIYCNVIGDRGEEAWIFEMYDAGGRFVLRRSITAQNYISLEGIPAGFYHCLLKNTDGRILAGEKLSWY